MPDRFILPDAEYAGLKKRVYQRDSWKCRCCAARSNLHAHHILFRSEGGGDFSSNLVTLCEGCHIAVHGRNPTKFIQILAHNGNRDVVPDADEGLRFKRYTAVRRRITWKHR